MWLRDFLPDSVPKARIMTYGYDTRLPGSQSTASVLELSRKLLESVKAIRSQQEVGLPNEELLIVSMLIQRSRIAQSFSLDIALGVL